MRRCQTRHCPNPAMGLFAATSRGQLRYYAWCGACGFAAHTKRRMRVDDEQGREYVSFPRQFQHVELVEIFGASYDGVKTIKRNPGSVPLSRLLHKQ